MKVTSTLAINSSTPISGNYDIRLTIITPATTTTYRNRPIFYGLSRAANIGDKIYLCFDAKILSGTPGMGQFNDGEELATQAMGEILLMVGIQE